MSENTLPYRINDADNHFNEPSQVELAIRSVKAPDGSRIQLFAGHPSKFWSASAKQVTFSRAELDKMLGDTSNVGSGRGGADRPAPQQGEIGAVPGMLLNR